MIVQMHPSQFSFPSEETQQYIDRGDHLERIEPAPKGRQSLTDMKRGRSRTNEQQGVAQPHENDVCLGRGGTANKHSGNEKLRQFARLQSENYRSSSKKGKSSISRLLVEQMRELDPPSRFLKKDADTGLWHEVGDDTAREKASQVLRDAVALLPDTSTAAVAVSQYAVPYLPPRLEPSTQETTPALESVGSSSVMMHPASPGSRRKRRRYSDPFRERAVAQSDSYERYPSQVSYTPVVRHHNSGHFPRYRSRSSEPPPSPSRRYARQARSDEFAHAGAAHYSQQAAGVARLPVCDIQPNINEFDLFQGELLESDVEDETEPPNHGSSLHGDLF